MALTSTCNNKFQSSYTHANKTTYWRFAMVEVSPFVGYSYAAFVSVLDTRLDPERPNVRAGEFGASPAFPP